MVAYAFQNRTDHLALARFQSDIKKHTRGIGILKRTAIAVQPRRKDHAARSGRDFAHHFGHIFVQAGKDALHALRHMFLFEIDTDLVEGKVVLDPLQAFPGGLHLGKVVKTSRLYAHNGRDHGGRVHHPTIRHSRYPSGGAAVDMGIPHVYRTGTHADQGGIPAAAKNRRPRPKAEFLRSLCCQTAHLVRGFHDPRKMLPRHFKHPAHLFAESFPPFAGIIQKRGKGTVPGHDELPGAAPQKILLDVQPLVGTGKGFRFMLFDPLILPDRVLHTAGDRAGDDEARDQFFNVGAGDLQSVGHDLTDLLRCALIHITHGAMHGLSFAVHQYHSLHLGAEGDPFHLLRAHIAFGKEFLCGFTHGVPPFLFVLLRAAVRQDIKPIAFADAL